MFPWPVRVAVIRFWLRTSPALMEAVMLPSTNPSKTRAFLKAVGFPS